MMKECYQKSTGHSEIFASRSWSAARASSGTAWPFRCSSRRSSTRYSTGSSSFSPSSTTSTFSAPFWKVGRRFHVLQSAIEYALRSSQKPGCRFNRLKNPSRNPLKNLLRFQFDSVTCLNYPFLEFSQSCRKSIEFSKELDGFLKRLLNWHPEGGVKTAKGGHSVSLWWMFTNGHGWAWKAWMDFR